MSSIFDERTRLAHSYHVLKDGPHDFDPLRSRDLGPSNGYDISTTVFPKRRFNSAEVANTIFNRLALDASMVDILHVSIDSETSNQKSIKSGLNNCITIEANIDQSSRAFFQDLVYSLFDEGVVAVVPVDTTINPTLGSFDIDSMRVAKITQWFPAHIEVEIYNDRTGKKMRKIVQKKNTAIIDNPLYAVTNARNSTLQRLLRKMSLIDSADEASADGKMNLIFSLPYAIKTDKQREQANERIENFQNQLKNNKYGVAYADASEKVTQLNREISSNIFEQIKYLTEQFYNQIGLTENVFNGTANEAEIRNYYSRTIDPIISRITAEFSRKFLTKTARTQGHTIVAYRDPFKLVPVEQIADIADKFRRNEILASNEIRGIVGYKPSSDPLADQLRNPNIADVNQQDQVMLDQSSGTGSLTSPE